MDNRNFINNDQFYLGFEGEEEVILGIKGAPEYGIHVWDGYFNDILGSPVFSPEGWTGFTRDYQEFIGAWGDSSYAEISNPSEYLEDLLRYRDRPHKFGESADVLELLIHFLEWAVSTGKTVVISTD